MRKIIILCALILISCISFTSAVGVNTQIGNNGATVFIGEEGLNISDAMGVYNDIGWWSSGANIYHAAPDRRISVLNRKLSFSVTPAEFTSAIGSWYRLDLGGNPVGTAFYVADPYMDIQIWNKDMDSSVTNKVVTGTKLTFKVDTNLYSLSDNRYNTPAKTSSTHNFINIRVLSSSGASYTKLYGSPNSLENADISDSLWNGIWDTGAYTSDGLYAYPSGEYTVYAETNVNRIRDNYKQNGADYTGKTITALRKITLTQAAVSISSSTTSVSRGKSFTISVSGSPKTRYFVWVSKSHDLDNPPQIQLYQEGVDVGVGGDHVSSYGTKIKDDVKSSSSLSPYYANITTNEAGLRNIVFTSLVNSSASSYTIRVESEGSGDNVKYDEVGISVAEGGITITSNGDQSYYLGDTIKFEGVNTESQIVYIYLYGPNLPIEGAQMDNMSDPRHYPVVNNDPTTFKKVNVNGDGSWKWDWRTNSLAIDAGTYIVYAVTQPKSRNHLLEASYGTTSIKLSKPTLTATASPTNAAKGDPVMIKGYAEGNPSNIAIWIMGTNYMSRNTVSVSSDSSFSYELTRTATSTMSAGQYYVVIQHPMQNNKFDIVLNGDGSISNLQLGDNGTHIFQMSGAGSLQGTDAATALTKAIEDQNVDDMYTKLYFTIGNPVITIDSIGDKYIGDQFTITGQTNLNIDTTLSIDIISSTFKPTNKSEPNEFSGASITTKVTNDYNNSYNRFAAIIDTSTFKSDEYVVTVSAIGNDASSTALFIIKSGTRPTNVTSTRITTPSIVPTVMEVVKSNITTIPTPTPTKNLLPGYTSITALVGLVICIFIIRKKYDG